MTVAENAGPYPCHGLQTCRPDSRRRACAPVFRQTRGQISWPVFCADLRTSSRARPRNACSGGLWRRVPWRKPFAAGAPFAEPPFAESPFAESPLSKARTSLLRKVVRRASGTGKSVRSCLVPTGSRASSRPLSDLFLTASAVFADRFPCARSATDTAGPAAGLHPLPVRFAWLARFVGAQERRIVRTLRTAGTQCARSCRGIVSTPIFLPFPLASASAAPFPLCRAGLSRIF